MNRTLRLLVTILKNLTIITNEYTADEEYIINSQESLN